MPLTNFPYTLNLLGSPFPPLWYGLNSNMFAAAINPAEDQLTYAVNLGQGNVNSTALGADGNFYLAGQFDSTASLPLLNPVETDISQGGFVMSLKASGELAGSTPFGGHFEEQVPTAMAVDSGGDIFLASAPTPNGELSNDPLDPVNVGAGHAYSNQLGLGENSSGIEYTASIAKISPSNQPQISLGYNAPYLVLRDAGSADLHISSITYSSGTQSWGNCGTTVPAGTSCFLVPGTSSGYVNSGSIIINSDAQPAQQTFEPVLGVHPIGKCIHLRPGCTPHLSLRRQPASTSPAQSRPSSPMSAHRALLSQSERTARQAHCR